MKMRRVLIAIKVEYFGTSYIIPRFQTVEFDPCLDDSVMFARKLRSLGNKVTLDILPGLPHGFLNFLHVKFFCFILYELSQYIIISILLVLVFVGFKRSDGGCRIIGQKNKRIVGIITII